MTEIEIQESPVVKREVKIDKATRHKLLKQVQEESHVIVHCSFRGTFIYWGIRIWKSTFLYAKDSKRRSKLLHCENITLYPTWTPIARGQTIIFTLIFSRLPKSCKEFDLIEKIPEAGGFELRNIQRNKSDVYIIDLN